MEIKKLIQSGWDQNWGRRIMTFFLLFYFAGWFYDL